MKSIKWGIIGPGKIAQKFARDLLLVEGGHLRAVASRSLDRARAFTQPYDQVLVFDSYEAMVKSGEIDIAYIATPHSFHLRQTLLCLRNKVAVLCEKPAGINLGEVQQMTVLASNHQTFFMEALWTRFIPSISSLLEIIDSGEMGEVEEVEAEFCFKAPYDEQGRLYNMALAGGSILDIGIYPVFLAYLLLGLPQRIEASGQLAKTGADQTCSARLFYANHKSATLHCSILYHSDMPARIAMTKGYILLQPRWHESPAITVLKAGQEARHISLPPVGKGFSHEIVECHHCLNKQKIESNLWRHEDSQNTIRILDEIRRQVGVVYPADKN